MNPLKSVRLAGWALLALALSLAVWAIAPQQLPVSLYKIDLVALAGVLGYWLDRGLFPYARPDAWSDLARYGDAPGNARVFAACMLRRALVVGAAMLAVGLGA